MVNRTSPGPNFNKHINRASDAKLAAKSKHQGEIRKDANNGPVKDKSKAKLAHTKQQRIDKEIRKRNTDSFESA
jgi:hypothetical protein